MLLHWIPIIIFAVCGLAIFTGNKAPIASAEKTKMGIAPLLHPLEDKSAKEKGLFSFLSGKRVGKNQRCDIHVPAPLLCNT
jgi:hypothetical protein